MKYLGEAIGIAVIFFLMAFLIDPAFIGESAAAVVKAYRGEQP